MIPVSIHKKRHLFYKYNGQGGISSEFTISLTLKLFFTVTVLYLQLLNKTNKFLQGTQCLKSHLILLL